MLEKVRFDLAGTEQCAPDREHNSRQHHRERWVQNPTCRLADGLDLWV